MFLYVFTKNKKKIPLVHAFIFPTVPLIFSALNMPFHAVCLFYEYFCAVSHQLCVFCIISLAIFVYPNKFLFQFYAMLDSVFIILRVSILWFSAFSVVFFSINGIIANNNKIFQAFIWTYFIFLFLFLAFYLFHLFFPPFTLTHLFILHYKES